MVPAERPCLGSLMWNIKALALIVHCSLINGEFSAYLDKTVLIEENCNILHCLKVKISIVCSAGLRLSELRNIKYFTLLKAKCMHFGSNICPRAFAFIEYGDANVVLRYIWILIFGTKLMYICRKTFLKAGRYHTKKRRRKVLFWHSRGICHGN